ncbi:hypothetical protein [Noviherbaspirillum pedocola]|uniref:Uncharacterized protein n=1 Tax=Noviherbaspirillum pedocola TaxID=2801341 RepID=A0A934W6B5_9BURK|nr:hypothetical protein [Noviherbaspirillum pedocola]MBK4733344.1 hypothetical protein [Noviherbaspirillum pedocola]
MAAVVMAHDFETEHAGQRRHVGLALVFVAGNEVDRIAGALAGSAGVVHAGDLRAATGRTSAARVTGGARFCCECGRDGTGKQHGRGP